MWRQDLVTAPEELARDWRARYQESRDAETSIPVRPWLALEADDDRFSTWLDAESRQERKMPPEPACFCKAGGAHASGGGHQKRYFDGSICR